VKNGLNRSGFTIVELLAVTAALAVGGSVLMVSMGSGTATSRRAGPPDEATKAKIKAIREKLKGVKEQINGIEADLSELENPKEAAKEGVRGTRATARQLKDATHIRGMQQSLVIFANQNGGSYPLPSEIDKGNATIAGAAESKNTTANIFSILIFGGNISTELCISPVETNPNIKENTKYEFNRPRSAAKPSDALWDPAFSADFTGGKTGNFSYAHLQPCGPRLKMWQDTFVTTEAVVSNRGPEIAGVTYNPMTVTMKNSKSNTCRFYGAEGVWKGNTSYNDGHVEFSPLAGDGTPRWPTYVTKEDKKAPDVFFYDEPDAKEEGANTYLGVFTKSGKEIGDWTAIWD